MAKHIFITGGAGFIGSNAAAHFIRQGHTVTVMDNLSRTGSFKNLDWLQDTFGANSFSFIKGDIRDFPLLCSVVADADADAILHLAGQVAVTTSVEDPRTDFENNALGTFNLLEAVRLSKRNPALLFSSTNKVYGAMDNVEVVMNGSRYEYTNYPLGIPESYPIDFHSPYGCSKGAADQYVRDYARIYGLRTVTFRQSCIYGQRQMGMEDQGWLAWFNIAVLTGKPITIYGDGKQVRDILHIDDLIELYDRAIDKIDYLTGKVFNIGGGPENVISVWAELGPRLMELAGMHIPVRYADWRAGDQKIFISDIRYIQNELGWKPQISTSEGIQRLWNWTSINLSLFQQ